jgi:hypothetical protein
MKRLIVAALALCAAQALAEQKHGIEIYPAAKADAATAKMIKDTMKMDADTYRTTDSVAKVTEFYRKQGGLKENPGSDNKGSSFMGKGTMLTVQNPGRTWQTGKMNNDTLISIVKQK